MSPRAAGELPQLNWLMRRTCATPTQRDQRARAAYPQLSFRDSAKLETTAGNESQLSTRFIIFIYSF